MNGVNWTFSITKMGIPHVRLGESFHAPIMWVQKERFADASALLNEVLGQAEDGKELRLDDAPDDDSRFYGFDVSDINEETHDLDMVESIYKRHDFFGAQ